jgi:hypothetical protein
LRSGSESGAVSAIAPPAACRTRERKSEVMKVRATVRGARRESEGA